MSENCLRMCALRYFEDALRGEGGGCICLKLVRQYLLACASSCNRGRMRRLIVCPSRKASACGPKSAPTPSSNRHFARNRRGGWSWGRVCDFFVHWQIKLHHRRWLPFQDWYSRSLFSVFVFIVYAYWSTLFFFWPISVRGSPKEEVPSVRCGSTPEP